MKDLHNSSEIQAPANTIKALPGPMGIPFLGSLFQLTPKKVYASLESWADEYGPIYKVGIPGRTAVVIADADLNRKLLQDRPAGFSRMYKMEPIAREMGVNGVYFAEGNDWRRQRFFSNQALAKRQVDRYFPLLTTGATRLKERWQRAGSTPLDVKKDLMRFTVDVTTRIAFGYDMNTLENDTDEIRDHLEHIFPMIRRRLFMPLPYWRWFRLPIDRRLDHALVEIRKVVNTYIELGRKQIAETPSLASQPANFLQALLVAEGEDGTLFTEQEIFANIFTMLLAGEDTTATSLTWMLYFMAGHPSVQSRMQEEVDAVLGTTTGLTDLNQLRALPYTTAVAHEAMRLKPIAPALFVDSVKEMKVAGLQIPPQTPFFLLTRYPNIDPARFPEPLAFRPERWLGSTERSMTRQHPGYVPFGSGPRTCPGRNLALQEIVVALAMVVRNFDLVLPKSEKMPAMELAKTSKTIGLKIAFQPRS